MGLVSEDPEKIRTQTFDDDEDDVEMAFFTLRRNVSAEVESGRINVACIGILDERPQVAEDGREVLRQIILIEIQRVILISIHQIIDPVVRKFIGIVVPRITGNYRRQ